MSPVPKMDWSPATITTLREMAADGLSSAQIGAKLGCSRDAVIAKARKVGVPLRPVRKDGKPYGSKDAPIAAKRVRRDTKAPHSASGRRPVTIFTPEQDEIIRTRREAGDTWQMIGNEFRMSRGQVRERGRRIGAAKKTAARNPVPAIDPAEMVGRREPLQAGHPASWDLINRGLSIEGNAFAPYEVR